MDSDFNTAPQFTVGRESAYFLISSGILHQSWKEIHSVSTNNVNTFLWNEYEGVVYVTFPSLYIEDFMVAVEDSRYGDCNIQHENTVFSSCLKGNDDMPARVHKGALHLFLHILQSSDFKARMESFLNKKKEQTIIFVGHSIGGAVATLATLWILEKRVRHISPICITFGSPLVGDARLGQAIGLEDWTGKFCHVVSKYDIVPRMLLAPFESIVQPLSAIVPHWQSQMGIDSVVGSHPPIQEACRTLLHNVVQCTSTIANNYPGEFSHRSPYRPFGTYMFCSTHGAACIEDSDAVLKMLHFTIQSNDGMNFDQTAGDCISEHACYGHMLEDITEFLLKANIMKVVLKADVMKVADFISGSSFEMGTALELEAMGVGAQNNHALLALREAGYLKNKYDMNIEKLNDELSKHQSHLSKLEWYIKETCKNNGPGYYDAFKSLGDKKDFHANLTRISLKTFWDGILEKVTNHVLPSDFRFQNKWINAGTAYRRLVEPLDIADYYRAHRDNGSYLSNGARRPRHIALEKWLKEKDQTRIGRDKKARTKFASLNQDSCFWARVEEACKVLPGLQKQQDQHQFTNAQLKESLEFEEYVGRMIKDKSISVEVFLEGSSFMIWWKQYRNLQFEYPWWQSSSPLFNFMENEKWK